MVAGASLAPETLGLSVIAGLGASMVYTMGTDAVAAVSKKAVKSKGVRHVANKLKDGVVDGANTLPDTAKDDANIVSNWFTHLHW